MTKDTDYEVHPLEAALVDVINTARLFPNDGVRAAIQGHITAALQLWPLRYATDLEIPRDERYVVSALQFGSKARAATESLLADE